MSEHPPSAAMASGLKKQRNSTRRCLINMPIFCLEKIFGYLKEPSLTRENLDNRVPLKNRFDRTKPEETNIYVEKKRRCNSDWLSISHTCKKLRTVINYRQGPEAVLDVMFVPNVGLFPTWILPPLDRPLRIVVRIVRFEDNLFPSEWVEAALHKPVQGDEKGLHRTIWSLFTVFTIFIADRLTLLRDPSREDCNFVRAVYREEPAHWLSKVHIQFKEVDYYPAGGMVRFKEIKKQDVGWNQMHICEDATPFGRAIFEKPLTSKSSDSESESESRARLVVSTRGSHRTSSYQLATKVVKVYRDIKCNQFTYYDEYSHTATTYMEQVCVWHPQLPPVVSTCGHDERLRHRRVLHDSSAFTGRENSAGVEQSLCWRRHLIYERHDAPDPSDGKQLGDNDRAEFWRGLRRDNHRRRRRDEDAEDAEADDNQRVAKRMKGLTLDDRVGTGVRRSARPKKRLDRG